MTKGERFFLWSLMFVTCAEFFTGTTPAEVVGGFRSGALKLDAEATTNLRSWFDGAAWREAFASAPQVGERTR